MAALFFTFLPGGWQRNSEFLYTKGNNVLLFKAVVIIHNWLQTVNRPTYLFLILF